VRRGAGELRLRLQALYLPLIYYLRDFCVGRALCRESRVSCFADSVAFVKGERFFRITFLSG